MDNGLTIQEGNKLIAEFMGFDIAGNIKWVEEEDTDRPRPWMIERPGTVDDLEYHTSWDWLMPVVEKIDRLNYDTYISHTVQTIEGKGSTPFNVITCRIEDYWSKLEISETGETKIQAVYRAVLQFIKWYTNQNK